MLSKVCITGVLLTGLTAGPAAASNVIYLDGKGCAYCRAQVGGLNPDDMNDAVTRSTDLWKGRGTVELPERFTQIQVTLWTRSGKTGWGTATDVVASYRGKAVGDRVTRKQSRRSRWGKACFQVAQAETFLSFTVVRDRNKRPRNPDATWAPWNLRAWASPQLIPASPQQWHPTDRGRLGSQNTYCGGPWM